MVAERKERVSLERSVAMTFGRAAAGNRTSPAGAVTPAQPAASDRLCGSVAAETTDHGLAIGGLAGTVLPQAIVVGAIAMTRILVRRVAVTPRASPSALPRRW
jgi:hypothetical protein